jgi:hypothetical protein
MRYPYPRERERKEEKGDKIVEMDGNNPNNPDLEPEQKTIQNPTFQSQPFYSHRAHHSVKEVLFHISYFFICYSIVTLILSFPLQPIKKPGYRPLFSAFETYFFIYNNT